MEDDLENDLITLQQLVNTIDTKITNRMAQLKIQESNFEKTYKQIETFTKRKVKLDVGGKLFSTSLNILTQEESFFTGTNDRVIFL